MIDEIADKMEIRLHKEADGDVLPLLILTCVVWSVPLFLVLKGVELFEFFKKGGD